MGINIGGKQVFNRESYDLLYIVNPLENIQFRYRIVKCKICNGTGIDKTQSNMGVRCEKCDGTGSRTFPDGPVENCTSCQGRGKNYRFSILGKDVMNAMASAK